MRMGLRRVFILMAFEMPKYPALVPSRLFSENASELLQVPI